MPTVHIYGLDCSVPEPPPSTRIDGCKLSVKKQKFRRYEWKDDFNDDTLEFDGDGHAIYTEQQIKIIDREIDRCTEGYWCMVKGVPTWLPGFYYTYVTYFILENGEQVEYRDPDRLFCIFFEEVYNDPKITGVLRLKKRREGASSIGCCFAVRVAAFGENMKAGIISKTGKDAEDLFQANLVNGYMALPIFLQPRLDGSTNPKSKLLFLEQAKKGKGALSGKTTHKREGLNSSIEWRNTRLNSFDSGRLSFLLADEAGKWDEVDINRYWQIVQQVLVQGASKQGTAYLPTTVNPPKSGGDKLKILWDKSNQFKYGRDTPSSIVQFFQPAEESLAGFIDEYGFSVINPPDRETLKFLISKQEELPKGKRIPDEDLMKGAAKYLDSKFENLVDDEDRDERRRMYPRKIEDCFSYTVGLSPFNIQNIDKQLQWLRDNPVPLRKGRFEYDFNNKVQWYDDNKNGQWLVYKFPNQPNQFVIDNNVCRPQNTLDYGAGSDTFKFNTTQEIGSNGTIWVGSKLDITKDEDEEGGEPVAFFIGRPRLKSLFFEEGVKACLFYGCTITYEKDATDEYIDHFRIDNRLKINCLPLLGRKPDAAINKNRITKDRGLTKGDYGVSSADSFIFSRQLELGAMYIEKYYWKIMYPILLEDLKILDPEARTKRDVSMGFLIMLLNIIGDNRAKQAIKQKEPLLQAYRLYY